ncbi:MAG: TIM barrel protein [Puniceicoccales bacterium]|nr:TIM barrel protein [Puniceicoccales bacterium]
MFPFKHLRCSRLLRTALCAVALTSALAAAPASAAPAPTDTALPRNVTSLATDAALDANFRSPPSSAATWVFWMWPRTDSTFEAVTRDIEAMRAQGIGGALLYECGFGTLKYAGNKMVRDGKGWHRVNTKDYAGSYSAPMPLPPVEPWGKRIRELYRHASKECGRNDIKLVLSVGLAGTSGPIPIEHGQQLIVASEAFVTGPRQLAARLPDPPASRTNAWASHAPAGGIPATLTGKLNMPAPVSLNATTKPAKKSRKFSGKEIAVLAFPKRTASAPIAKNEIINLTKNFDADGILRWKVPAGEWTILRFAYIPTGASNQWGFYSNMLSKEASEVCWGSTIGKLLAEMSPDERKGLYGVEDDSWEAGITTWTKTFPEEFLQRRAYDLIPLLPALLGKTVNSAAETEKIRRDFYRTIADLIADNHYGHYAKLAAKNGLLFFSEAAGPHPPQIDPFLNSSKVNVAMGEYWVPSPHRPTPPRRFMLRNAATANHIYGKLLTPCEAFTSGGPHWEDTFFEMKNTADQGFADGCNLPIIHCFSHSPSATAEPGYVYWAGTHYTRQNTWWRHSHAFNTYLARCSYILRQGLFVADALYYYGDAIAGGGGIGGIEPMKTRPARPAEGYDHDNCNLDVLLNRVSVKNGRITLPDGMSYRVLVVPKTVFVSEQAKNKLSEIESAGGVVVHEKKETPADVLKKLGVAPDLEWRGLSADGEIDWLHRATADTDFYFIASRWEHVENLECTFRIAGKQPELWNPVTGEIRNLPNFRQTADGRTIIPLKFEPRESVFVVFRKKIENGRTDVAAVGKTENNYLDYQVVKQLTAPWKVTFDPKKNGAGEVVFAQLQDWSKSTNPQIRHYSGTAVYRTTFSINTPPVATEIANKNEEPKNFFYAFCITGNDPKNQKTDRNVDEQNKLLAELGYDGVLHLRSQSAYRGFSTLSERVASGKKLGISAIPYYQIQINGDINKGIEGGLAKALEPLKDSKIKIIQVDIRGGQPSDASLDDKFVEKIYELRKYTDPLGIKVVLYPHIESINETFADCLRIAKRFPNHEVGVMFNLCHWAVVDQKTDFHTLIREAKPYLSCVTISGMDNLNEWKKGSKWTNLLRHAIKPLGVGSFDIKPLLKTLREIDYRGPIGLQCAGIRGETRTHLTQSMNEWKKLTQNVSSKAPEVAVVASKTEEPKNFFYAFCITDHDTKKRNMDEQNKLLAELGYDGILHLGNHPKYRGLNSLPERVASATKHGISVIPYCSLDINKDVNSGLKDGFAKILECLRDAKIKMVQLDFHGGKPSDITLDDKCVARISELRKYTDPLGIKVVLYPHIGGINETLTDCLRIARRFSNHEVGVMFNLCHWAVVNKNPDIHALLKEAKPYLSCVTISGMDDLKEWKRSSKWNDLLRHAIKPLGVGSFDIKPLLKTLREIDYRGPIGLQCYGIRADAKTHLTQSMNEWKKLTQNVASKTPEVAVVASKTEEPKNLFYAFCLTSGDAKKRNLDGQNKLLAELGYEGVLHLSNQPIYRGLNSLPTRIASAKKHGISTIPYYRIHINRDLNLNIKGGLAKALEPIKDAKLKMIQIDIYGGKPSDASLDDKFVAKVYELRKYTDPLGIKVVLYPHIESINETLADCLRIAKRFPNHEVGVMFNLCHWAVVDQKTDFHALLREAKPYLSCVTISGMDDLKEWTRKGKWSDLQRHAIKPLGVGSFDIRPLLKTLREIDYRGPIGLQCHGIGGDSRKHLTQSMNEWKKLTQSLSDVKRSSSAPTRVSTNVPTNVPRHFLNLGDVREIAAVRVNGVSLGVVWTKPARIEITHALRTDVSGNIAAENTLEIEVTNLWMNRLIGDEQLPKEQRITETNMHKFTKATPLLPSGLIGPVILEKSK